MRSFAKKLACVLASAAMVVTMFPAAQAQAADKAEAFAMNVTSKILYANVDKRDTEKAPFLDADGKEIKDKDKIYNKSVYDFNLKNKPKDWSTAYTYSWASDNEKVATVAKGGIVTAVASGVANITCVITNKETKEQIKKTAKVTVRENAAKVVISNAAKYDETFVSVDQVVDLDRTMYTVDERKTSGKRTTTSAVTDRTAWVVEPSEGVKVNQANGQFTFTKDAEAGTYKLYCYTYQSDKHPERVAVSDPVTVVFNKEVNADVRQKTVRQIVVSFDSVLTVDVKKETVHVIKESKDFEYPAVVKEASLDKTGTKLTIDFFTALEDKASYKVIVDGVNDTKDAEPYKFVASNGTPVRMTISPNQYNETEVEVIAGAERKLYIKLYDAADVQVDAPANASVWLNPADYANYNGWYVTYNGMEGTIMFDNPGTTAKIAAEYHSNDFDPTTGDEKVKFPASFEFISVKDTQGVGTVTYNAVKFNGAENGMSLPLGTNGAELILKVKSSKLTNEATVKYVGDGNVADADFYIDLEETSQDVLALEKNEANVKDGYIKVVPFKEGTANIIVNMVTKDNYGNPVKTPIKVLTINVTSAAYLESASINTPSIVLGNTPDSHTGSFTVYAKNQYKKSMTDGISFGEITGLSDAAKACAPYISVVTKADGSYDTAWDGGFTIKASIPDSVIESVCGSNNSTALNYKVNISRYGKTVPVTFVIRLQLVKAEGDVPMLQKTDGEFAGGNIARFVDGNVWNSEYVKSVTITAFQMNSNVRKKQEEISGIVQADGSVKDRNGVTVALADGKYYVKVSKGAETITKNVTIEDTALATGSAIKIEYTSLVDWKTKYSWKKGGIQIASGSAVVSSIVDLNPGAGNYNVTLYQGVYDANSKTVKLVQKNVLAGSVTANAGSYGAAQRVSETISKSAVYADGTADQAAILKCFKIADRQQSWVDAVEKATAAGSNLGYYIDYTVTSNYVNVQTIYFYEKIDGNTAVVEYAIDAKSTSLKIQ